MTILDLPIKVSEPVQLDARELPKGVVWQVSARLTITSWDIQQAMVGDYWDCISAGGNYIKYTILAKTDYAIIYEYIFDHIDKTEHRRRSVSYGMFFI